MSKGKSLAQLMRVRHLEEEQCRLRLESALAVEQALERAMTLASERARWLRSELKLSMLAVAPPARASTLGSPGDALLQRQAVELEGERIATAIAALRKRLAETRARLEALRGEFLEARIQRMQVETVLSEQASAEALFAGRRHQRALDDWFGSRAAQKKNHCGRV